MSDLRSRRPVGRAAIAGHVAVEFLVDGPRAGDALARLEAERTASHHLGHLGVGVRLGQPFRHDRQHVEAGLPEGDRQQREWQLHAEENGLVVRCAELVRIGHDRLAERVALGPALDAGDAVARQHRRVVVEPQTVPQHELPLAVRLNAVAHLRLRLELAVDREQRVEDGHAVIARDVGGRPDGIEDGRVRLGNESQRLRVGRFGNVGSRESQSGWRENRGLQERASLHGRLLRAWRDRCFRSTPAQVRPVAQAVPCVRRAPSRWNQRGASVAGLRWIQGRAISSWPAKANNSLSPPKGPSTWTPMGRPSLFQCSGKVMAGWPV